jgi:hypothetical protein
MTGNPGLLIGGIIPVNDAVACRLVQGLNRLAHVFVAHLAIALIEVKVKFLYVSFYLGLPGLVAHAPTLGLLHPFDLLFNIGQLSRPPCRVSKQVGF